MWRTEYKVRVFNQHVDLLMILLSLSQTDDCTKLPLPSAQTTSYPRPSCLPQIKVFQSGDPEPPQKTHLGAQVHQHTIFGSSAPLNALAFQACLRLLHL